MSKVKDKGTPRPAPPRAKAAPQKAKINETYFAIGVTLLFYVLSVVGVFTHESWRDEYQAFLVASHSTSIPDLMYNMKYEGHPLLWHLLLFVQSRLADTMLITKFFHITCAAATVWMICRYLPIKLWQRVLLCFSYFLFYEYNLITRTYAVGVMLFTLAVVIYRVRYIPQLSGKTFASKGYVFAMSLVLLLLANTSVIGIVMCGCILALMVSDLFAMSQQKKLDASALLRYGLPVASALVGIVVCMIFIKPEPDNTFPMNYTSGWSTESFKVALTRMFTNLVMLLPNRVQFWNKHLFDAGTFTWVPWAGLLVLVVSTLYFLKNNRLLLFFLAAAAGMFGFVYFTNMIQVRYSGHWFVMFAMAYALSLDYRNAKPLFQMPRLGNGVLTAFVVLFNVALVTSTFSGLTAYGRDLVQPFSNLDAAGKYVLDEKLNRFTIVGATDFVISPISYFTGKPIRMAESNRMGYFIRWNKERAQGKLSFPDVIKQIETVMKDGNDTVPVILDTPLRFVMNGQTVEFQEDNLPNTDIHLKLVHQIDKPCIVEDELYYFYIATRVKK